MAEQEEPEQALRFTVIVQPPDISFKTKFCILEEGDLCDGLLEPGERLQHALFLKPSREPGKTEPANLPFSAAYCHVDGSHFIFGGTRYMTHAETMDTQIFDYGDSEWVISYGSSPPAELWEICGDNMPCPGSSYSIAVPCGSKIYLFGLPGRDVLIYDPRTRKFLPSRPMPENFGMNQLVSYFLWPDISAPRKNPLIMLHYRSLFYREIKLISYDVGADSWEIFDPKFPSREFNLLLPGTNTLLIMDSTACWLIYDLSARRLTGETVSVAGMWEDTGRYVINSFCRRSSCGSFLIFAFIMGFCDEFVTCPDEVAYAKIRLTPPPQGQKGYVAVVESQGDLIVGPNYGAYISAEPSTKRKGASSSLSWGVYEEEEDPEAGDTSRLEDMT